MWHVWLLNTKSIQLLNTTGNSKNRNKCHQRAVFSDLLANKLVSLPESTAAKTRLTESQV